MRGARARSVVGAIAIAALFLGGAAAWAQSSPPTVIKVPPSGAGSTGEQPKGDTFFQVAGEVALSQGEGAIPATLGDLLRSGDTAGLDKVRVIARAPTVSTPGPPPRPLPSTT